MIIVSSCSCLCPMHWSQVVSREWRCSWSRADRRCSNYIWVISNFNADEGATYIRGLTVIQIQWKFLFALIQILMNRSLQIFAQDTTALWPQHVKNWVLNCKKNKFLLNFNYVWKRIIAMWNPRGWTLIRLWTYIKDTSSLLVSYGVASKTSSLLVSYGGGFKDTSSLLMSYGVASKTPLPCWWAMGWLQRHLFLVGELWDGFKDTSSSLVSYGVAFV